MSSAKSLRSVLLRLVCVVAVTGWAGVTGAAPVEADKVAKVKSAYLLNFLRFTEWPPESFERPGSPLQICVLGHDSLGSVLDTTVRGQTVAGRSVAVQRFSLEDSSSSLSLPGEIRRCHLVFIGDSEADRLDLILGELAGSHMLTVGETASFATDGTMLALNLERDRIIFYANPDAIRAGRVGLSSKILQLARIVRGEHGD